MNNEPNIRKVLLYLLLAFVVICIMVATVDFNASLPVLKPHAPELSDTDFSFPTKFIIYNRIIY